jgi:hypothetical protein
MHRPTPPGVFVERRNPWLRQMPQLPELSARFTGIRLRSIHPRTRSYHAPSDRVFGSLSLAVAVCSLSSLFW